jgi:hypothetical protein
MDAIHVAAGQAFYVSVAMLRRLQEQASDFVVAGNRFDEAIMGGAVATESAIFHVKNI